ncbi:MAG: alpha/beta hydrolase [Alphaproteobacteria bacterium]
MSAPNPAPEGVRFAWLRTRDGVRLRAACWPGRMPVATIVLLQGRTECIEKYYETIAELQTRDYAVVTWRGQGLSDRALPNRHKGHVRDFAEYHDDMDSVLEKFVMNATDLPAPYILMAHSMGAHIAVRYLHHRPQAFARAVLCSPMAYINTAPLPNFMARAIASAGTALGLGESYVPGGKNYSRAGEPFEGNRLTGDPARFERNADILSDSPDLALGSPTLGWLDAAFRSMEIIMEPEFGAAITTPALLAYGDGEQVSLPDHQARLASQLGRCRAICITGARHEILQETNPVRDQFWAAFDRFNR